jgi:TonB family protein
VASEGFSEALRKIPHGAGGDLSARVFPRAWELFRTADRLRKGVSREFSVIDAGRAQMHVLAASLHSCRSARGVLRRGAEVTNMFDLVTGKALPFRIDRVECGVPGGVVGGVLGGLPEAPPPPAVAKGPVRIGGQIQAPALMTRVEPTYPSIAVSAHLEGIVILEAIVDRDGTVEDVKVLRSVHPLLDCEATSAVKQWQYLPLVLNGAKERFVLTVTLSFNLQPVS